MTNKRNLVTCLLVLLAPQVAKSDYIDKYEKGLNVIERFASNMCEKFQHNGRVDVTELSLVAKAEVSKIVKDVVQIGFEAAKKYQTAEYTGLLQKDLLTAISDRNKCKIYLFDQLKDKLLAIPIPSEVNSYAGIKGASGKSYYNHTTCVSYADENGASSSCITNPDN